MEDKTTFENRGATLIRNFSLKVGGQAVRAVDGGATVEGKLE